MTKPSAIRTPTLDDPYVVFADAVPIMVWLSAPDGRRTFFNRQWLDFRGRTLAEEAGEGWIAGVHPDDRATCQAAYEEAGRTGHAFKIDFRLRRADGVFRYVADRVAPRLDEGGQIIGLIGCCVDVTARFDALHALKASETRFRLLADNARDMIFRYRVQPDFACEYVSPAALTITGRAPQEFLDNPELPAAAIHPEDRALALGVRADPTAFPAPLIIRWLHPDGRIVHVEHCTTAIYDANGQVVALEGIGRDVTERVEAARRLADSESRFRLLAEHVPDAIYRYRVWPSRGIEYVSPGILAITGHAPEEFYADPELSLRTVHPDDRPLAAQAFEHDSAKLDPTVLLRWVHPDGRIVWAEHRRVPVFDENGRMIAIEGIGRDVSERIENEARLRESENQLRRLAAGIEDAREKERTSIARELHDELGQSLAAIKMDLAKLAPAFMSRQPQPASIDLLQSIAGEIDVAVESVRRLATALRPPTLDHLGLLAAIEVEAAAMARRTGIRCRIAGNRRATGLTAAETTAVFRMIQEALTNVARHSGASAVNLSINGSSRVITVKVQDNGRGVSKAQVADPNAIGLRGMFERAGLIGAQLAITSKRGKGTLVSIVIPRMPARRRARAK